jgi:hypothetical protein
MLSDPAHHSNNNKFSLISFCYTGKKKKQLALTANNLKL